MLIQKNSSKICKPIPINTKNRVKHLLCLRQTFLFLFIFSLPFNTYGILKVISLVSNSSSISIYPAKINEETSYHPTSIPWIDNSSSCEKSGRVWENEQCWDGEHSALF
ncbi:hypothetical protein WJM97_11410 [Okeanomitos corallinicola TIOX110]|uniref:Uncharacterized protein n=1 Tax=Okeanomitos corallinicola TIOX110 TaxID=3133117 RepID=A0ABZ2ULI5_9CYAN